MTELKPIYSNVQSFYNKAYTTETTKGLINRRVLYSYGIPVCEICFNAEQNRKTVSFYYDLNDRDVYSMTTGRHIIEFLKQNDCLKYNVTFSNIEKGFYENIEYIA